MGCVLQKEKTMINDMSKFILGFLSATAIIVLILLVLPAPEGKVYDCSIAEFHPDFPPKVKEECRKKRIENRKNTLVI